jgi:hypothetical protein
MLLEDRVVVGTGRRYAVLAGLFEPTFPEDEGLYLGVVSAVTHVLLILVVVPNYYGLIRDANRVRQVRKLIGMSKDPRKIAIIQLSTV